LHARQQFVDRNAARVVQVEVAAGGDGRLAQRHADADDDFRDIDAAVAVAVSGAAVAGSRR